jgi:transposase InsO family protein
MIDRIVRRRRWAVKKKLQGWSAKCIASVLDINEKTVDRWYNAYKMYGYAGLEARSKAAHIYYRTPAVLVKMIVDIRQENNWGASKIEAYMKQHRTSIMPCIGHSTIHKILVKHGFVKMLNKRRRVWGRRRFERAVPNELWQADFKLTRDDEWMITYLDDHSRFVTGSRINHTCRPMDAINLLEQSVRRYGIPRQVITDRGGQFYIPIGRISDFTKRCIDLGIEHIVASIRRPSTIGKIEAFHHAYEREASMFRKHNAFINYWNYNRPHQGIGYLYPAQLYFQERDI